MTAGIPIPAELPAAAEAYAMAGIKIFRVRRNKAPFANCTRCDSDSSLYVKHRPEDCQCGVPTCHGFHAATSNIDLIRRWWREEPDANIGAPCKLNGWAVIDMDPRNGGRGSLCGIEERVGVLPGTTMQITGGDGLHMLYLSPGFDLPKEPFPGVEFKHNNYVVLAPSLHKSGARYRWPGSRNLFFPPEIPWPAALLPRKEKPRPITRPHGYTPSLSGIRRPGKHWTTDALVQHVMDASQGNRNDHLYFAACRAHEAANQGHIDLYDALQGLHTAASAMGLTESEARATIESAGNRPSDRTWAA
ncbi:MULTISPECIES: bifunctional DNA primase/polymerase [unclassified Streptomyces]|uniref:bifunctional DNA primase/polymerase n=1 Tax=unclassified Streptomyces TaxID=2593676 RepID=UPI00380A2245